MKLSGNFGDWLRSKQAAMVAAAGNIGYLVAEVAPFVAEDHVAPIATTAASVALVTTHVIESFRDGLKRRNRS